MNVARSTRPRERILARTFQRYVCESCGQHAVIDDAFTYVDFPRKQLYAQFPRAWQPRWRMLEPEVIALHHRNLVDEGLPIVAREIGVGVVAREVFGLEALREKIVVVDAGLDDATLEALKLELYRDGLPLPSSVDESLRLDAVTPTHLVLVRPSLTLDVPRARYDEVAGAPHAALRDELTSGPYVDVARLVPLPG